MPGSGPAREEGDAQPALGALDQMVVDASSPFPPHSGDPSSDASAAAPNQAPDQSLTQTQEVFTPSINIGNNGAAAAPPSPRLSAASSISPALTSNSASQSQRMPFGPPRPPSVQQETQRTDNRPPHAQSVHEGVIHSILEGLFGPMMQSPSVAGNGSASLGQNAVQPEVPLSPTPGGSTIGSNGTGNDNQRPRNPDIGTMFSMFGFPSGMVPPSPGNNNPESSSTSQSVPTTSTQSYNGPPPFAQPRPQQRPTPVPSGFSFTFDLGPFDIPGPAGPSTPGNQNPSQGNQENPGPSMSSNSAEAGTSGGNNAASNESNHSSAPTANQPNSQTNGNARRPPLAFIVGPGGSVMFPNSPQAGAADGLEGNAESRSAGNNGQGPAPFHFHFPGGSVTSDGNAGGQPPFFQLFSQIFPNGVPPLVVGPGMMNFAFGPQSFMQTRLPPDPERAEELLRGLKDPGMDSMMRLDRVIRADYNQGMAGDGGVQADGGEGDAEGWKCAVCMETFEDELEEHRRQDPSIASAETASIESSSSRGTGVGRNPSISSDLDMHDVEMVLAGELREIPKNKTSLKVFPCHHVFHEECLRPWLAQKTTCPTCRFDIDPHSVTLRRPVVRNNPLRPRGRNTAASTRATPYGSRPDTPSVRAGNSERASSGAQTSVSPPTLDPLQPLSTDPAAPHVEGTSAGSAAALATPFAASAPVPTFTPSDAPRSPFAFTRTTRAAQFGVDAGHMDRPPPTTDVRASSSVSDDRPHGSNRRPPDGARQEGRSNLDAAAMQDAVHMLHEILRRGHPEHRPDSNPSGSSNNNNNNDNNTNNADQNQAAGNRSDTAAHTDGSQAIHANVQQNASVEVGDVSESGDNSQPRNHSHTIAIFEISIPDLPAHMMPDTFQGPNDGVAQPFGGGVFQSFMIPFGHVHNRPTGSDNAQNSNRTPGDNVERNRTQSNANQEANQEADPRDAGDSQASSATLMNVSPDAISPEGGEGNRSAHPPNLLHRWRSDPEHRHITDPLSVPLTGPGPESATGASNQEAPPLERRRGDHPWHPPHVKESFSDWIVSREKALHWRCDDPICLYAPPEHPYTELTEEEWRDWKPTDEKLTKIKSYNQYRFIGEENTGPRPVCQHEFHPSCLKVSCLSSNWWYKEPGRPETTVRCPKCRMQGWIQDEEVSPEQPPASVAAPSTTS